MLAFPCSRTCRGAPRSGPRTSPCRRWRARGRAPRRPAWRCPAAWCARRPLGAQVAAGRRRRGGCRGGGGRGRRRRGRGAWSRAGAGVAATDRGRGGDGRIGHDRLGRRAGVGAGGRARGVGGPLGPPAEGGAAGRSDRRGAEVGGVARPSASACSRAVTRAASGPMSSPEAASGMLVSWTSATSSSSRGSGAWRISTSISPSRSIARTILAAPRRFACSATTSPCRAAAHELGRHQRQEAVAEVADDASVTGRGSRPCLHGMGDRRQRATGVALDQRLDELVERHASPSSPPALATSSSAEQRVASRTAALLEHCLDCRLADVEPRVGGDPAHVLLQLVDRQQVEAQVLRAAADRVADLLRVGGGEHEHDVRRRFLERLQQRGLGRLESMWTSSRMYTLCRPGVPSEALSIRSRIASTPLLLAASSSWTS